MPYLYSLYDPALEVKYLAITTNIIKKKKYYD